MAVNIEKVVFEGYRDCIKISNGAAELIVLTEVGPRVISYSAFGGSNHFKVYSDQMDKRGGDDWRIMGGHRLWTSPELAGRADEPDNDPVDYEIIQGGVRLIQKPSARTLTQKIMTVTLDENSSKVTVKHEVKNTGMFEIELSAWALSVMDTGGVLAAAQVREDTGLLPNRTLSLWPYSKLSDDRVYLGEKYFTLEQRTEKDSAFKLGMFAEQGGAAYFNHGQLFVKRFGADADEQYPDWNCNFEAYVCAAMLECESLSPLCLLAAGESVELFEEWELYDGVSRPNPRDEAAIEKALDGKLYSYYGE